MAGATTRIELTHPLLAEIGAVADRFQGWQTAQPQVQCGNVTIGDEITKTYTNGDGYEADLVVLKHDMRRNGWETAHTDPGKLLHPDGRCKKIKMV